MIEHSLQKYTYKVFFYIIHVPHMFSEHRLQILNVDELVNQAIEAHKCGEIMEITGVCIALLLISDSRYYGI